MVPGRGCASVGAILAVASLVAGCGGDAGFSGLDEEKVACGGRLGCASAHNLAVLAARPSDLAEPRREGPRDARRRDVQLTAWRGERAPASPGTTAPRQQDTNP